jgi:hypothetical protein
VSGLTAPLTSAPEWWQCPAHTTGRKEAAGITGLDSLIECWPNLPERLRGPILLHAWSRFHVNRGDNWRFLPLFRACGFMPTAVGPAKPDSPVAHERDPSRYALPDRPIRLYRGVYDPEHLRGLSWTSSLAVARYWAASNQGSFSVLSDPAMGYVWAVHAPPESIFALMVNEDREVLLDPDRLTIAPHLVEGGVAGYASKRFRGGESRAEMLAVFGKRPVPKPAESARQQRRLEMSLARD